MSHSHSTETHVRDSEENEAEEEEDLSWDLTRTFLIPPDAAERVQKIGRILNEENVEELYYDRHDYVLTLNGLMLFTRNGSWNLRFEEAVKDPSRTSRKLTSRCLTSAKEIIDFLALGNIVSGLTEDDFHRDQLKSAGFTVFHRVSYGRKVFGIPSEADLFPAKVTLEFEKFGFCFGEIEVSVDDRQSITTAFRTVDELARKLDFEKISTARGLRKFCGV